MNVPICAHCGGEGGDAVVPGGMWIVRSGECPNCGKKPSHEEKLGDESSDKPIPEDAEIQVNHPHLSGSHETYAEAMRMVGAKRSKGALVDLVNWLLMRLEASKGAVATAKTIAQAADRMREHEKKQDDLLRTSEAARQLAEADAATLREAVERACEETSVSSSLHVANCVSIIRAALAKTPAGAAMLTRLGKLERVAERVVANVVPFDVCNSCNMSIESCDSEPWPKSPCMRQMAKRALDKDETTPGEPLHYACVACAVPIVSTGMCPQCSRAWGLGRESALAEALKIKGWK